MDTAQKWASLGQFALGAEAEIVESLLETFEVPYFRKYDREGAFTHIYLGNSRIPVEIMVPDDRLSEAKELLENHIAESELESEAEPESELEPEPN
ncbi:MAG: DUF2007 domain-containing protein [Peptococcaceae bacterium]|nr:DUF2007 domain-containing protein [Peptococcaceae bacterium]